MPCFSLILPFLYCSRLMIKEVVSYCIMFTLMFTTHLLEINTFRYSHQLRLASALWWSTLFFYTLQIHIIRRDKLMPVHFHWTYVLPWEVPLFFIWSCPRLNLLDSPWKSVSCRSSWVLREGWCRFVQLAHLLFGMACMFIQQIIAINFLLHWSSVT